MQIQHCVMLLMVEACSQCANEQPLLIKGEGKHPHFLKSARVYANLQEYDCGSSACNRKYSFCLSINNKDRLFQKNA